jgi:hypothetical protein
MATTDLMNSPGGGPDWIAVPLPAEGDLAPALAALPASAGVGQILGRDGASLLIGQAANLRRWATLQLGLGPPPAKPGRRPRTNLRPVAGEVRAARTTSAFGQRLLFERVMAPHVPWSKRRDLRPPGWLALDLRERFPRVVVAEAGLPGSGDRSGPFRDRRAAGKARDLLLKRFALRPCDFAFEPSPELALGLGCLYAQVRSCAAPCLGRASEAEYRALAAAAADFLERPSARGEDGAPWLPPFVSMAQARALVVEPTRRGIELYPVRAGRVLEEAAQAASSGDVGAAVERLDWPEPGARPSDIPWLGAWLHAKRKAHYLVIEDAQATPTLAERIRSLTFLSPWRGRGGAKPARSRLQPERPPRTA